MPLPVEDYALIGDCQTAALVGRDGSMDWAAFPRFDSGACFAALLGTPEHGRWRIAPSCEIRRVRRRYRPGTLVLETDFETDEGTVTLVDCMPPRDEAPDIVRMVVGRTGKVPLRTDITLRFDYGKIVPWVRASEDGLCAIAGPDRLDLRTPVPLRGENLNTVGQFTVAPGEQVPFTLTWSLSYRPKPECVDPHAEIRHAERWWSQWSNRCTYHGPWKSEVIRSLITLKALTYEPTGGLVAAPTTSLPEQLGGVRNWDYRYCWIRDATFTLYALMIGGYLEEARAWRDWLVRAVAGKAEQIQIMYGVGGERRLDEWEVPWLPGYEGAKPVRVGNAASTQLQLDVFGEVLDALHLAARNGLEPDENAAQVESNLLDYLESIWQCPDEGIWEVRGPPRPFVHSKVMAWLAFDRGIKMVERSQLEGPIERWRQARHSIHREVCEKGFNARLNSFVQYYGADFPDAALLRIPLVGFLPASDPRMIGTLSAIEQQLLQDGFVKRYPTRPEIDGLPPGEGAFLPCTFWYIDNLVLQGRRDEAREKFEQMLSLANDVGLLSEEYDWKARRLVGNFPQAFSHVALINSARNLCRGGGPAETRKHGGPV
jgi:GH15 family glucan-1,4-alpha-glucosidase